MIISRLNGLNLDENSEIDYFQKCEILNSNPVLVARHFQYRVETFFKEIILHKKSPLGSVENYAIKVEFQFRGLLHVHCFIWVKNAPLLTRETKHEYVNFINSIVRVDLPDKDSEPDLKQLVSKYQTHCHSRSVENIRTFHVAFAMAGILLIEQFVLSLSMMNFPKKKKQQYILTKRQSILKEVKLYIDEYLDPHKPSYKENYICYFKCIGNFRK